MRGNFILPFLILLLALAVRIYHHHHILMSDEANNMLTIKALIEGDGYRDYFFKHPPLYVLLSALVLYPIGDSYHAVQGISIIFSVLALIPIYLIVDALFDRRTALLSLIFTSIMPLNIAYSTWIKQEAMLLFFFLWTIYFYISGKPFLGGVLLGVSSLVKEFAWFLVPIIIGWELLGGWPLKESIKRLFLFLLAGIVTSAWWYVLFGAMSFGAIGDAVVGGNLFEYSWHFPWYYYFSKMPHDFSLLLFVLFVFGLFSLRKRAEFLPLVWAVSFYVPLSIIKVKAPWYTYLASPAIAIIAAAGFFLIWEGMVTKWLKSCILFVLVIVVPLKLFDPGVAAYFGSRAAKGGVEVPAFDEKEYLLRGRRVLAGEKMVALLNYNPTLQYYLGIPDRSLVYLGAQFPAMKGGGLLRLAVKRDISYFVLDINSAYYIPRNVEDLTSLWGEPERVGDVLLFRTRVF